MSDFVELRKVISIILRRWWLLVLLTAMVAAAGYVISNRQPRVYEASVTLLVGELLQGTQVDRNDVLVSQMLAQTYADLARRQPVLQGAIETLGLEDTWTALRSRVTVSLIEETQLLQIKVRAGSPEQATRTADEIASQLILLSPSALVDKEASSNEEFVRNRLESLRSKIETGQTRLQELETQETEMVDSMPAEQLEELQREIHTLEGLIAAWENSYSQFLGYITTEQSPNFLAVIEPAHAGSRPILPRTMLNTVIAAAVGFGLALGLIFVWEFADDTLKSPDDLSETLGLTALGTIGRIKPLAETAASPHLRSVILPWGGGLEFLPIGTKGEEYAGKLVTQLEPSSSVAEDFRRIRNNVQFLAEDRPMESILVTSPASGEGKSVVAANLSVVMARAGLKTILVDANLRQPVLHEIFNLSNAAGLTDLLADPKLKAKKLLKDPKVGHLQVLTSGETLDNPSELLASERMDQLLTELRGMADVVILDSPPVSTSSDSTVLANQVDGAIIVIRDGQTRKEAAKQTVAGLQLANINLMGAVLNARPRGLGWIAGAALALLLIVAFAVVMLSGRGSPSVALPAAVPTTSVALTAAWTSTAAVLPTNTTDLAALLEATSTAIVEPTAAPTTEPAATDTPEPTATDTPEPTATDTPEPTATPTAKPATSSEAAPASTAFAEPTITATDEPTATPTRTNTATATAAPTRTPTRTPRPSPTPTRPNATATQPATTGTLLPAPMLLAPAHRQDFQQNSEIVLAWLVLGESPPDAYTAITVAYAHDGETWYDDVPWTQDTTWTLSEHSYLLDLSDNGEFRWSVQVMSQTGTGANGKPKGVPLSPQSEERVLIWRPAAGGGGGDEKETPPPPPP